MPCFLEYDNLIFIIFIRLLVSVSLSPLASLCMPLPVVACHSVVLWINLCSLFLFACVHVWISVSRLTVNIDMHFCHCEPGELNEGHLCSAYIVSLVLAKA